MGPRVKPVESPTDDAPLDPPDSSRVGLDETAGPLEVRQTEFSWLGEFADRKLENEFRNSEVHGLFCALTLVLCAVDGLLFFGSFIADIAVEAGELSGFGLTALILFLAEMMVAVVTLAALHRRVPLIFSELALCAVLVSIPAFSTFFTIDEGHAPPAVHFDAPQWFPSSHAAVTLILLSRFMFVGLFFPIRPVLYSAILGLSFCAFVFGDLLVSEIDTKDAIVLVLAALVMKVFLVAVNVQLSLIYRGKYWFYRETRLAVAERERLVRHETESALKLKLAADERRARSRLIRMVMHDLRSPLLSVSNVAALLAAMPSTTPLSDEVASKCITSLSTCSSLTQQILSDMLDFERIDSGRLVIVARPFLVRDLLEASQATFEGLAKSRGITLTFAKLPPSLGSLRFVGDLRRLQQCLNNGISNALKFSDKGGTVSVSVSVDLSGSADGESGNFGSGVGSRNTSGSRNTTGSRNLSGNTQLRLRSRVWQPPNSSSCGAAEGSEGAAAGEQGGGEESATRAEPAAKEPRKALLRVVVRDTGIGLSAEDLALLTEGAAFSQVGRGKEQGSSGTGLGLSIARQILAMHGSSRLEIESEGHGKGTSYIMHMLLPRAPPAPSGAEGSALASKAAQQHSLPDISAQLQAIATAEADAPPAAGAHSRSPVTVRARLSAAVVDEAGVMRIGHHPHTSMSRASGAGSGGNGARESAGAGARRGRADGFRCLYVEDDAFLQLTVPLRVFAPLSVDYDVAENGAVAVELVSRHGVGRYNVIVMDNQMPSMSGAAATRVLREKGFHGIIIGMTGDLVGCEERNEFESAGLDLCVGKDPEGISELIEHVRSFADAHAAGKEAGHAS